MAQLHSGTAGRTLQKPTLFTFCPFAGVIRQSGHPTGQTGTSVVLGPHQLGKRPLMGAKALWVRDALPPQDPSPDAQQNLPLWTLLSCGHRNIKAVWPLPSTPS